MTAPVVAERTPGVLPRRRSVRVRRVRRRVLGVGFLAFVAAIFLLPVYVMLITGLKSFEEVSLATMWDLPSGL